ncbi:hypothetical protein ACU4HD_46555 [Cupriavidus basilensis]
MTNTKDPAAPKTTWATGQRPPGPTVTEIPIPGATQSTINDYGDEWARYMCQTDLSNGTNASNGNNNGNPQNIITYDIGGGAR